MNPRTALATALLLLLASCGPGSTQEPPQKEKSLVHPDSVLFSFAFVGCNRIDRHDTESPHTNASTANLPELKATFDEVAAISPKPDLFFFLGDLVLGLDRDTSVLRRELSAWKAQYEDAGFSPIAQSGIKMIAIPGNHEMLYYNDSLDGEYPLKGSIDVWDEIMRGFMPDPPVTRVDTGAVNSQTYAFRHKNTQFIVLNTDTYNADSLESQLPAGFVQGELAKAHADPAVEHIFLLGHKPAYIEGEPGLHLRIDPKITDVIWPAMTGVEAEAMLSAHAHQYTRTQPKPGTSYQVVAGNGGSPYTDGLASCDHFFGYSVIYILKNGKVILRSMGRQIQPDNYLGPIPAGDSTTLREEVDISWGTKVPDWDCAK